MARASWGNVGVDYSSFFSDLYRSAENKKKSDQRAADNAAAAAWAAGEMDSDAWLAYIAQRLAATTDDPEEQSYWRQRQMEDTQYVEDERALEAFNATNDTAAYLEYQRGVLAQMAPGSKGYADRENLVFQWEDQLDKENFTKLNDDLVKRLQGTADAPGDPTAYKDLIALWKRAKSEVRAGSTFMPTVDQQLADAENGYRQYQAIKAEGAAGADWKANKITGKQYAAKLKAVADKYYASDPTNYYRLVNLSTDAAKYGNGRIGGSGSGGGSGTPSATRLVDQLKATRDRNLAIQNDIANALPGSTVRMPDGRDYPVYNPDGSYATWVDEFHARSLLAYDALADAQRKSSRSTDNRAVGGTLEDKSKFLSDNVRLNNTIVGDRLLGQSAGAFQALLTWTLDNNPDPNAGMRVINNHINDVERLISNQTRARTSEGNSPDDRQARAGSSRPSDQWLVGAQSYLQGLRAAAAGDSNFNPSLFDTVAGVGGAESVFRTSGVATGSSGFTKTTLETLTTVNKLAQSTNCLNTGACRLFNTPDGTTVVPLKVGNIYDPTSGGWVQGETPDLSEIEKNYGPDVQTTDNVWVKIGGRLQPVTSMVMPYELGKAYRANRNFGTFKKGQYIPSNLLTSDQFKQAQGAGAIDLVSAFSGEWDEVVGGDTFGGRRFIVNRATGQMYDLSSSPLSVGTAYGPDGRPVVQVDGNGAPIATLKTGMGALQVPGALIGVNVYEQAKLVESSPSLFPNFTPTDRAGNPITVAQWVDLVKSKNVSDLGRDEYDWDGAKEKVRKTPVQQAAEQSNRFNDDTGFSGFKKLADQMGIKVGNGPSARDSATGTFIGSTNRTSRPAFPVTQTRDDASGTFVNTPRIAAPAPAAASTPGVTPAAIPGQSTLPSQRDTSWEPAKITTKITQPSTVKKTTPAPKKTSSIATRRGSYKRERL